MASIVHLALPVAARHHDAFDSALVPDEVTLAEVLKQRGYADRRLLANLICSGLASPRASTPSSRLFAQVRTRRPRLHLRRAPSASISEALKWLDGLAAIAEQVRRRSFSTSTTWSRTTPTLRPRRGSRASPAGRPPPIERVNARRLRPLVTAPRRMCRQNLKDVYDAEVISVDTAFARSSTTRAAPLPRQRGRRPHRRSRRGVQGARADRAREDALRGVVHVPLIMLMPGHGEHKDIDHVSGWSTSHRH